MGLELKPEIFFIFFNLARKENDCVQEFDGASRQNPGPAGAGAVLFSETGEQVRPIRIP